MKSPRPLFFAAASEFGDWLERNHQKERELWVGFYKKETGRPTLTWSQSVDEALCYGWIDGIRKTVDGISYTIRFTPRKSTSTWSKINLDRVAELTRLGRMRPAGLKAFEERVEARTGKYSYEQRETAKLTAAHERRFRADKKAWTFFQSRSPSYRKKAAWWVISAKQEQTRLKRLEALIARCESGRVLE